MVHALKPATRQVFARRTERRVLEYIHANEILVAGEPIIVAVSGGPDSTALLAILHRLSGPLDSRLTVAHFNHRLRGPDEAAADLEYVVAFAAQLGLPLVHGSGDVRARSRKRGESIEDAARSLRYAFLAREAKKASAGVVVTGHNLNDQAETVLLHIARGAGLDGFAGMRPRAPWPFGGPLTLSRPLLCLPRPDIERYCREMGFEPRRDETNEHVAATRNRIRLRVLPELEAVNPRIAEALARLATAAAADTRYLDGVAGGTLRALATGDRQRVILRRASLRGLAPAIAARVVRGAIQQIAGTKADIETIHLEGILMLVDRPPARISLPHGLIAHSDSHSIHIRRNVSTTEARITAAALEVPGQTLASGWAFHCETIPAPKQLTPRSHHEAYLDHRFTRAELAVRSRRPGDRLHPLGLSGSKKLQDILVDAKVPAEERDAVPIICDDAGILWVVGHCLDERARVGKGSREVLHITARKKI